MSAARLRRLARDTAITLGGGAAIVLALELLLRAFGVEPRGAVVVDEETCYHAWGSNTHDVLEKRGSSLVHRVWTDEHGFRISAGQVRAGMKCRVIAVGDSFTHGQFVSAEEAFPALLERSAREHGYSVEVDNGGMPGHTIAEERVAALGRWARLSPRIVIVTHTANDLEDLIVLQRSGCRLGGPVPAELRPALDGALGELRVLKVAQLAAASMDLLSPRQRSIRQGSSPELRRPASAAECAAAEQTYLALALDLTSTLAARDTRALFAFVEDPICGGVIRDEFAAELGRRLGAAGAAIADVRSALWAPEASLRPADSHPSPLGHRRIADGIAAALFGSGWLAGCE